MIPCPHYALPVHRIAAAEESKRHAILVEEAMRAAGKASEDRRAAAEDAARAVVPADQPLEGHAEIARKLTAATFAARRSLGRIRR